MSSPNMLIQSAPLKRTADQLRDGSLDLLTYIDETVARLDAVNPQIQAFLPEVKRHERLRREAADLQARFPVTEERPPLYGILVGVKDIFHVDGFETKAGSTLPSDLFKGVEAPVVTRLKALGALILGKTVTTEFAYFEPGQTRNPYNLAHTPGGSSSGSAAAVAAGLCPLALGTQTIGSVIRPAAYCGIVGFKPSFGRLPTAGVIPISASLDHIGLFAQDMIGVMTSAGVLMEGVSWKEVGQQKLPTFGIPDGAYLAQAAADGLAAFAEQVARLERAGYHVKRMPMLDDIEAITLHNRRLMSAEMAVVHTDWFDTYESRYRPRTKEFIIEGRLVSPAQIDDARAAQIDLRSRLENRMQAEGVDIWISPPAMGAAPLGIDSTGSPAMNLPWTFAGLPALTFPAGSDEHGLPFGLQCIGAFGSDAQLLTWAQSLADVFT